MAFTLSNLLQAIYAELGQFHASTATGGSTTTVVDGKQAGKHSIDAWKDGAVFIVQADGAAPEWEFKRVSAYADSTGTFTLESALTAAAASGDTFGFVSEYYPLQTMIELVNAALRSLGDIALVDTTTLDTAAGKTEYAASVAWKRRRPLAIDYQGRTGASGDNDWVRVYDWELVPAAPGSAGLIVFNEELPAGRDIRIWYVDSHPRVSSYSHIVSETLTPELAIAAGVERALRWQNSRLDGQDLLLLQRWNDAKIELARSRLLYPIWTPRRVSKFLSIRSFAGER